MSEVMSLDSNGLKRIIGRYHERLTSYRDAINRLNVYPVPDGDTGTNMSLTMGTVVDHVRSATSMAEVADAISHGSLMGARGNSGVILSQILRGLADTWRGVDVLEVRHLVEAFDRASAAAYRAVLRPVEGTILTVLREAAEAARQAGSAAGADLAGLAERVYRRAAQALERTPELLPVLKQAGVVDAGGAGFLLLLAAFLEELTGTEVLLPEDLFRVEGHPEGFLVTEVASLRYEVMFFLNASEEKVEAMRSLWAELGDSIVVVGGGGEWNCHIHTDDIGPAIEAGAAAGRPFGIRVTDLYEQMTPDGHSWGPRRPSDHPAGSRRTSHAGGNYRPKPEYEAAPVGVIPVVAGDGLVATFRDLGAQAVVTGGQSMNPSTRDLLDAVDSAPALTVILLPNNKNIIPVAEQVDVLTPKQVLIVPTQSIPQGLAAMVAYRPDDSDPRQLAEDMTAAAASVTTGEITQAVRDAVIDLGVIKTGEWLGLAEGAITVIDPNLYRAAVRLLEQVIPEETEVVTIFTGQGAEPPVTKALEAWLSDSRPLTEVQIVWGGQPLYAYLISAE
jgi:DAK2 domain fusion protein YloV